MKGFELKNYLTEKGIILSDLASKLGITPQGLDNKFKVKYVKSDFLHKVEELVGFKIDESVLKVTKNELPDSKFDDLIDIIMRKDEQIAKRDEQIDRLLTLLELKNGIGNGREKRNAI